MQSSCALPVRPAQGEVASLTRLFCAIDSTVVSTGLPFSCAARGSTRRILTSGAALAGSATRLRATRNRKVMKRVSISERLSVGAVGSEGRAQNGRDPRRNSDDFDDHVEATEAHGFAVTKLVLLV